VRRDKMQELSSSEPFAINVRLRPRDPGLKGQVLSPGRADTPHGGRMGSESTGF
jgi:hypothetical protein